MFRAIPFVLLLLAALGSGGMGSAALTSLAYGDPLLDEVPDGRAEVKALLAQLKGHTKQKGKEDAEAIGVVDKLLREFEGSGPKDRAAIVKGLDACFKLKRTKELSEGVPDDRLYMACAVALGNMGPESVKPLIKLVDNKTHRKNLRLQERIIQALGKTSDPSAVKTLVDLLDHHEPRMQAAGAQALGQFAELELEKRKEVFEDLVRLLIDLKTKLDADALDAIARDRWNIISGPIVETLQKLSGHNARAPEDWQRWWNKNKKDDWDAQD